MPGIGTIHGFCASSQASATWPTVASLRSATLRDEVDEGEVGRERLALEAGQGGADVALAELGRRR